MYLIYVIQFKCFCFDLPKIWKNISQGSTEWDFFQENEETILLPKKFLVTFLKKSTSAEIEIFFTTWNRKTENPLP